MTTRVLTTFVAGLLALASALVPIMMPAHAAGSGMPSLVARALQNTNSARTLVHRDQSVLTTPMGTVKTGGQGTEDEVHGRKHLQESIAVAITGADNKVRKEQYTVELIFVPGLTYYRTSLAPRWSQQKGAAFADPYTGGWEQGRTTVTLPPGSRFRGTITHGGQTQAHFTFANHTDKGTVDLWIAGRGTPYVVREEETLYAVSGPSGNEHLRIDFGSFNRPVRIVPPR
jgi:hypothetical protein